MKPWAVVALAAGLACHGLGAQQPLWQVHGACGQTGVGGLSIFLGDLDGDGFDDLATVVSANGPPSQDEVHFLSGRTGTTLRMLVPPFPVYQNQKGFIFWLSRAGDMDGDSFPDYAVTWTEPTFAFHIVEVRNGRDDTVLWQTQGGFSANYGYETVGDLDLNGDGSPDLVVAAQPGGGNGFLEAYDHTGRPLYSIPLGNSSLGSLGGDLDDDGCDDFLVGGVNVGGTARVLVISGSTGQQILVTESAEGACFGCSRVTGCGDVDGDGVLDFAGSDDGGLPRRGLVRVISGATGKVIYTFFRPAGLGFGRALAAGDLDLDGIQDLLIGSGEQVQSAGGVLFWYSLRDGSLVQAILPPAPSVVNSQFSSTVTIGPPQPGSPFPVFACPDGAFSVGGCVTGQLNLFRAAPAGVTSLGSACVGTLASAPQLGFAELGSTHTGSRRVRIHLSNAPPGANALLLVGLSSTSWLGRPLPMSLEPFGFAGCSLYTSIDATIPRVTGTEGIAAGYALFELPVPLGSFQLPLHAQWLVLGTGASAPGALSNGLSWVQ